MYRGGVELATSFVAAKSLRRKLHRIVSSTIRSSVLAIRSGRQGDKIGDKGTLYTTATRKVSCGKNRRLA